MYLRFEGEEEEWSVSLEGNKGFFFPHMVPLLEENWQEANLDWVQGKVCVMQDLQGMWTSHKNSIQAPFCTDGQLWSSCHYNE